MLIYHSICVTMSFRLSRDKIGCVFSVVISTKFNKGLYRGETMKYAPFIRILNKLFSFWPISVKPS